MKTLSKKLSREEMKVVKGGTNKTKWACYDTPTIFAGDSCSVNDPTTLCGFDHCDNTFVVCTDPTACP